MTGHVVVRSPRLQQSFIFGISLALGAASGTIAACGFLWGILAGPPLSRFALALPELLGSLCRIVIVGGGYIACEQACIFHSLGMETPFVFRQVSPF